MSQGGSITAYYSVLVEGDDENEPVADTMRGLLDGHIWLSRKLAARGHFPAVDVLQSISRLMSDVATEQHRAAAQTIRRLLAAYAEHEDLLSIGAYRRGTNRVVDAAVDMRESDRSDASPARRRSAAARPSRDASPNIAAQCQAKLAGPAAGGTFYPPQRPPPLQTSRSPASPVVSPASFA